MNIITITHTNGNTYNLPAPDVFKPQFVDFDSDDTKRAKNVVLHRKRIKQDVWTIPCKWTLLTPSELHLIRTAIAPEKFTVTFFFDGSYITKNMYAGNKTGGITYIKDSNTFVGEISFNLIDFADI